jgi:hypothetical protein
MTHGFYLWLPEKPQFKYPLIKQLPFDKSPALLIDFTYHISDWDGRTSKLLPLKRRIFYAWVSGLHNLGFQCPHHRHSTGLIGYRGWRDVSKQDVQWRIDRGVEEDYGWVLIGDNHDFPGDFLYANLWILGITNPDNIKVWTISSIGREASMITEQVFNYQKEKIVVDSITQQTSPLFHPNAMIFYSPKEKKFFGYPGYNNEAEYKKVLQLIHEPL